MADLSGRDSQVAFGEESTPGTMASSLISYKFDVKTPPTDIGVSFNSIERTIVRSGFTKDKSVRGMRKVSAVDIPMEFYTRGIGWFLKWLGMTDTITAPTDEVLLAATTIAPTMSLTTQPSSANRPAVLKCTVAGATAWGTITITGVDGNDEAISETLTYTSNTTKTTTKYFKTVNASGIACSGFTGGTLAVNGNRNTCKHTFALNNNLPSVTIEASKGGKPVTVWGCGQTKLQVKLDAPEGLAEIIPTFLGKDGWLKARDGTTTPATLSSLTKEVFRNWKSGLRIDGTLIGIKSVNFTIDNKIKEDTSEIKESSPIMTPKLIRDGEREITGTFNCQFEDFTYFEKWQNDASASLVAKLTSQPYAGPLETAEFTFPTVVYVGNTVSKDMGLLYQDVPFMAYGVNNDEMSAIIYSTDASY